MRPCCGLNNRKASMEPQFRASWGHLEPLIPLLPDPAPSPLIEAGATRPGHDAACSRGGLFVCGYNLAATLYGTASSLISVTIGYSLSQATSNACGRSEAK